MFPWVETNWMVIATIFDVKQWPYSHSLWEPTYRGHYGETRARLFSLSTPEAKQYCAASLAKYTPFLGNHYFVR